MLALLLTFSLASLVPSFVHLLQTGGGISGADGICCGGSDQFQYMAWIRQGDHHLLVGNLFDLAPPTRVFLHPMWFVSGLLFRLGLGMAAAYLVWKLVAVAVLGLGVMAYLRRLAPSGRRSQCSALVLAIFFAPPAIVFFDRHRRGGGRGAHTLATDLQPALQLWGYAPTAIAVGLMPLFLLGIERLIAPEVRAPGRSARWYGAWTAAAGLAVSWLHPWQGETLLLILAGLLAWERGARRPVVILIGAITALPLGYYYVLSQTDSAWRLAQTISASVHVSSAWTVAVMIAPLLAVSLPALRGAIGAQEKMLRLWPLAALATYFVLRPPFPSHALHGLTIPLAVLAVRTWRLRTTGRKRPAALAVTALVAVVVPGTIDAAVGWVSKLHDGQPALLAPDQRAAFRYLAKTAGGGVITTEGLGTAIPALTGHAVYVGDLVWSPHFPQRVRLTRQLLGDQLSARKARQRIVATGAEWVLIPTCGSRPRLDIALAALTVEQRRFGCVRVIRLRRSASASVFRRTRGTKGS